MGIEDIQISEELETNAPSIKYSGNEGPKSPQDEQRMMVAQLEEEYVRYVDDMIEQGIEPMSMQQFMEQAMAEGQMSSAQPMASPAMLPRQMAARGGIMGADGRTGFLFGGIKKFVRKVIPNEISSIAVKAAPFVAPFNPLAAGLMSGIGGFDQHGSISKGLKSGLMNYGMGQLARGIGGGTENLQGMSFKVPGGSASRFGQYFSSPMQNTGGLGKFFNERNLASAANAKRAAMTDANIGFGSQDKNFLEKIVGKVGEYVPTSFSDLTDPKKILGALGIYKGVEALADMTPKETVSKIMKRGEGLDLDSIRAEVQEAFKDQTGEKLLALRTKYPYLGRMDTKDMSAMAMGGRIGFNNGNIVPPVEMPDRMQEMLKNMSPEEREKFQMMLKINAARMPQYKPNPNEVSPMPMPTYPRVDRAEGGIMDLGGMEKDYRAEGGFVPIGKAEKADDVPARLSVNEFVFTADAVRNAGGGDIDKGAEIMENMMKNLEAGGQVSKESQGMAGAQQMFETSQRLSEVI